VDLRASDCESLNGRRLEVGENMVFYDLQFFLLRTTFGKNITHVWEAVKRT
jgi:hypothetical protein